MSISKAVISGNVVKSPEKRFTSNNVPITSFTINISPDKEATVLRVVARGKLAEIVADKVQKDSTVVVEGRLVTAAYKTNTGVEKKTVELDAQVVDVVGVASQSRAGSPDATSDEGFDFGDEISSDDLIGDDEIPF